MKLNQQDLEKIADLTLEHYNRRADDFWRGTRDHDVSQNVAALLRQALPVLRNLDAAGRGRTTACRLQGASRSRLTGNYGQRGLPEDGKPWVARVPRIVK